MILTRGRIQWTRLVMAALLVILMAGAATGRAQPAKQTPPTLDKTRKCPVCGMFVHLYPDFAASLTFNDGKVLFFDGAKDMFKCYFDLPRYAPGYQQTDIQSLYVTGYYDMEALEAFRAFFVVGSDVHGPMGNELIPLRSRADAREFAKDHEGRRVLTFEEVTPALIGSLD